MRHATIIPSSHTETSSSDSAVNDEHTRDTLRAPAPKKIHFYRTVACTKALGGKRSLWHARLLPGFGNTQREENVTGAGNTADNAIRDLAVQLKAHRNNRANAVTSVVTS